MMRIRIARRSVLTAVGALVGALAVTGTAWAHATLSPPVTKAQKLQLFTLAVPTEKENASTTKIELVVPDGFAIDSFAPSPDWKRDVKTQGSGAEAVVQDVTWSGGATPSGEDSVFSFLASPSSDKTYTFTVKQTYSDGSIVEWSGPESSDTPAPTIEAVSSLGGSSSSTLAIIALAVAGVALVLAIVGLVGGKRSLT
jgi:uncharacterized protein YcnI